jgi:hypothetical protein
VATLAPLLVLVVLGLAFGGLQLVVSRSHGRFDRIVACSEGHRFTTIWVPAGSFKAARLGTKRYQRCPVGRHWSIVQRVDPATLSDAERAAAAVRDTWIA